MTEYQGIGEFFSETGTEGGFFALLKDTTEQDEEWSYDDLIILKDGDELIVWDKVATTQKLWKGTISLEYESHMETNSYGFTGQAIFNLWCHGLQRTEDQEQWAKYFIKHYPMTLRRE